MAGAFQVEILIGRLPHSRLHEKDASDQDSAESRPADPRAEDCESKGMSRFIGCRSQSAPSIRETVAPLKIRNRLA